MNRALVLGALPAVLMGAIVAPMVLYWDELPDPMATHWTLSGPDGSLSPTVLLWLMVGIYAAIWLAVWRVSVRMPSEVASFGSVLAGVGGLLAVVQWSIVFANRGVADWTDAGPFNGLHIIYAVAGGLALAFVAWRLGGGRIPRPAGEVPTLDLAADETVIWSGRSRGTVLLVIGFAIAVVAVALWSAASIPLLGAAMVLLVFAEVRATVSARGVAVAMGWLGFPSWVVPMAAIERAEVEEVAPMAYGGWGYRIRPGVRAVVARSGPGLRLVRPDMPDLVLTLEDAETAAAVVNTLRSRM